MLLVLDTGDLNRFCVVYDEIASFVARVIVNDFYRLLTISNRLRLRSVVFFDTIVSFV